MQSLPKTILGIIIMVIILYVGLGILWANNEAVAADQYLHTIADEISTANLRQDVIASCQKQAQENGYELTYEKNQTEEGATNYVILTLKYRYTVSVAALSGWHNKTMTVY